MAENVQFDSLHTHNEKCLSKFEMIKKWRWMKLKGKICEWQDSNRRWGRKGLGKQNLMFCRICVFIFHPPSLTHRLEHISICHIPNKKIEECFHRPGILSSILSAAAELRGKFIRLFVQFKCEDSKLNYSNSSREKDRYFMHETLNSIYFAYISSSLNCQRDIS